MFSQAVQSVLGGVYPATRNSHGGIDYATAGFLLSLIEARNPLNLVEVGVASGVSSCLMLALLERMESRATLSSFDLGVTVYEHPSLPIGHLVKELFPAGTPSWRLHTQAMSADIAGRISGPSDFVFIDANHDHPWPAIDSIMAVGFTKPGSPILLHDINLPYVNPEFDNWGAVYLYRDWPGEKLCHPPDGLATSGAIIRSKNANKDANQLMDIIEAYPAAVRVVPDHARKLGAAAGSLFSAATHKRFTALLAKLEGNLSG